MLTLPCPEVHTRRELATHCSCNATLQKNHGISHVTQRHRNGQEILATVVKVRDGQFVKTESVFNSHPVLKEVVRVQDGPEGLFWLNPLSSVECSVDIHAYVIMLLWWHTRICHGTIFGKKCVKLVLVKIFWWFFACLLFLRGTHWKKI